MAMVVKNNMSAISTLNTLNKNSAGLSKSLAKVSSGQRVNGAADDASGYAISERMRVQVRALDQDNRNTQSGTSMMKVAEGAVSSTVDILKTLKEKVVSAANDDKTDSDRAAIQKELDQSIDQINDNANVTFNGKYLVDGSHNNAVKPGGVANTMTNESLNKDTTAKTSFDKMTDRNGNSLNIQDTDKVTISFVKEGKTYEASVKGSNNFTDLLNAANGTQGRVNGKDIEQGDSINTGVTFKFGSDAAALTLQMAGSQNAIDNIKDTLLASVKLSDTVTTGGTGLATVKLKFGDQGTEISLANQQLTATSGQSGWTGSIDSVSFTDKGQLSIDMKMTSADGKSSLVKNITTSTEVTADILKKAVTDNSTMILADTTIAGVTDEVNYENAGAKVYAAGNSVFKSEEIDSSTHKPKTSGTNYIGTSSLIGKDRSDLDVNTADGGNAITFTAAKAGTKDQVAGVTIKVEDQYGVINKSANAVLDNFSESIQAQNQSSDNAIVLQVGTKANQAIKVGLTDMRAEALGLRSSDNHNIQIGTQKQANAAINVLDNAISKALDQQTTIGSVESRLEYTSTNLTTASENVQASESTIRDADMAKEMTEYTKNNVLLQAAQSMLAQANQNSSAVLSLLQ